MKLKNEVAVFGGGCFWCTEAIFQRVKGVVSVTPGYAGGKMENPSYEEVSSSTTGHAEVIKIEFDTNVIKYEELLDIFFHTHDPTTADQQGADVGPQYRSLILTTTPQQQEQANKMKQILTKSGEFKALIQTEIHPLGRFFSAENYHKDYYVNHPHAPYCQLVIAPKIKHFMEAYKDKAVSP